MNKFSFSQTFNNIKTPLVSGDFFPFPTADSIDIDKTLGKKGVISTLLKKERNIEIKIGEKVFGIPPEKQKEYGTVFDLVGIIPIAATAKIPSEISKLKKTENILKGEKIIQNFAKKIEFIPTIRKEKFLTKVKNTFNNLYTIVVDRFNPITRFVKEVSDIEKLKPSENPILLARRYLGIKGIAESKLFYFTHHLDESGNIVKTGESLNDILGTFKKDINDLVTFMVAQREKELWERGIKEGIDLNKTEKVINALKNKYGRGFKQIERVSARIRDWTKRAILDPLREIGAISEDMYRKITESNQFYIPFQRVIDEVEKGNIISSKLNVFDPTAIPLKKIRGSEKTIINPLESLIKYVYKITDFVERERVAKSIVNLRNKFPELQEVIKPIKNIRPVAIEEGRTIFRPGILEPGKNIITVFEDGKRKFYEVPEDLAKTMKGMSSAELALLVKFLGFPTRILRAGAILSPEFAVRNPIRDQMMAFIQSKYGFIPGYDFIKGIFETFGKKELFGKWLAAGGAQATLIDLDRISNQKTLQTVIGKNILQKTGEYFKNPIEALRFLTEESELGTRLGVFKRAIKKVNDLEAAIESRDVTLDFSRIGSQTRIINSLVAFFNAGIQGIDKYIRSLKERPVQTTIKTITGVTIPSILEYLLQKDNPRYKNLPSWRRNLFWNIVTDIKTPLTPDGMIISIPKPFEIGVIFGTLPVRLLEWIDENDPAVFNGLKKDLTTSLSPGFIPTFLLPWIETKTNYSFFRDRPILSQFIRDLPPELQAGTFTSETARLLGKYLNKSPANIEHMFLGYTAGLGRIALMAIDEVIEKIGIVEPPPPVEKTAADIPILRAFIAREPIGFDAERVNQFFDIYEKAKEANNGYNFLIKRKSIEEAKEFLLKHGEVFLYPGLNEIAQQISGLRKAIEEVRMNKEMTPHQKRVLIDSYLKAITLMADHTMTVLKELKF